MESKTAKETKNNQNNITYLALALTLLLIIRLLPALKAPLSTYGYDFGFYYYAAKTAVWHWQDFLQAVWGGYNSIIFIFGHWLHLPPAVTLVGSYFLASIFLGWALYLLMQNFGKPAGVFAAVLLACSLFQSEAYAMFLWKSAVALPFLVLGFKFLLEKKYRAFVLSAAFVLFLHRTSAIILILTTAIYLIYQLIKNRRYGLLALSLGLGLLAVGSSFFLFNLQPIIINLNNNSNAYVRDGLFLNNQNLFALWWPSLALGLAGIASYIKNKRHPLLLIFAGVNLIWILFQLPFYRRTLIYLDIAVICFAAYFLGQINYSKKSMKASLAVLLVFLIFRAAQFTLAKQPLIYPDQISEIQNFTAPTGFVLAVSADDAPWLDAYLNNERIGAPGLLENPHTQQEWQDFWQGQNQREFLSKYPRPLYFYQRSWHLPPFGVSQCLILLSPNFYQLDYQCLEKNQ